MVSREFVDLEQVSQVLGCSLAQTHALVTSGELPAMRIREGGLWRVRVVDLEAFERGEIRHVS